MNRHHRKTLELIFAQPTSGSIRWREAEALLRSLGATLSERAGSRVAVLLNNRVAVFHRPHPNPDMDKNAVRDLRRFLENAGVMP
ncbi:MAG: type II toxin-antitoxin system HicA family toxin [Candidatus Latescibacteria bacterium]|nr:type II toxin-antitoxin system HicA family toxin [Candidatus Latescibacterota bacterium]